MSSCNFFVSYLTVVDINECFVMRFPVYFCLCFNMAIPTLFPLETDLFFDGKVGKLLFPRKISCTAKMLEKNRTRGAMRKKMSKCFLLSSSCVLLFSLSYSLRAYEKAHVGARFSSPLARVTQMWACSLAIFLIEILARANALKKVKMRKIPHPRKLPNPPFLPPPQKNNGPSLTSFPSHLRKVRNLGQRYRDINGCDWCVVMNHVTCTKKAANRADSRT